MITLYVLESWEEWVCTIMIMIMEQEQGNSAEAAAPGRRTV
jgi:hypothetical protein